LRGAFLLIKPSARLDLRTVEAQDGAQGNEGDTAMPDGTPGDDTFIGNHRDEFFSVFQGGNDTIRGKGGDDTAEFGFTFDENDRFDGGGGIDHLWLHRANRFPLVLTSNLVSDVEEFTFQDDSFVGYSVVFHDSVVAAGVRAEITLFNNISGAFDGHREKDGSFLIVASDTGDVTLIGGDGDDTFFYDNEGQGYFDGRAGSNMADHSISGTGVTIDLAIETPQTVSPGITNTYLNIQNLQGSQANDVLFGTHAANQLFGAGGADEMHGGRGDDLLSGSSAADNLFGGKGSDVFRYGLASGSSGAAHDTIGDFKGGVDSFLVTAAVTGVDPSVKGASVSSGSFDADLAAAVAGNMGASHAIIVRPDAGEYAGTKLLVVDINGSAAYEAGADLVIDVSGGTHLGALDAPSFQVI
jgi:Ca2+-binding RTX toxin-like protein